MLKKTMILALVSLMFIAVFPVWAGGGNDLKGEEIVIGNWFEEYDVTTKKPLNKAEEDILAWRTELQQENGFTMRQKEVASWSGMQSLAATSIMTGTPAAQVFLLEPGWAMALMAQGLLYPVSDSKAVNFKKPAAVAKGKAPVQWAQGAIDSMTFNGKTYGFAAGINLYNTQVVYFNKRLFREAGLDPNLPYDLQKAGTWTWDKFLEICKQLTRDTNNDGIMDTYALPRDLSTEILSAIVGSNGAQFVTKNARTGKFENATNRPEFLEALQYTIKLQNEGVLKPKPENTNWDWFKSEFLDGKVAMRIDESYVGLNGELGTLRDDWGIVLPPKGPRARNYTVYSRDNIMVIPSSYNAAKVDKILYAVGLWYTEVTDDWKSSLYNIFRDTRAVDETLALIRSTPHTIKYHRYVRGLETGNIAWEMWYHEGDPAQLIEAVSQSWNAIIADSNF